MVLISWSSLFLKDKLRLIVTSESEWCFYCRSSMVVYISTIWVFLFPPKTVVTWLDRVVDTCVRQRKKTKTKGHRIGEGRVSYPPPPSSSQYLYCTYCRRLGFVMIWLGFFARVNFLLLAYRPTVRVVPGVLNSRAIYVNENGGMISCSEQGARLCCAIVCGAVRSGAGLLFQCHVARLR